MTEIASGVSEFKRGWPIILSSALGIGLGLSPVPFYTIGVFAPELHREFGWGFGDIMLGIMVMTVTALIASPIAGYLADRYGVRRVALSSIVLFSLSFALFGFGNGSLTLFYFTWALMAAVGAGTLPITWTRVVNVWFERKKGLALGLALIGTGVFGSLIKPLSIWLIAELGWRVAYMIIAALPCLIALPVAFFFFKESPADVAKNKASVVEKIVVEVQGFSLKDALTDSKFWLLMLAVLPISFALGGPVPNMENILLSKNFTTLEIASIVPVIGISVLFGRALGGWLIDHFWAPGVAFVLLSLPAIACWILAGNELSIGIAFVSVFLIGFASGVEYDLIAFLIARYFGMKAYSTIYGFVYGAFAVGAGFGPTVFGIMYDRTQSYSDILLLSIVVLLLGAAMLLGLGRYRYTGHVEADEILSTKEPATN